MWHSALRILAALRIRLSCARWLHVLWHVHQGDQGQLEAALDRLLQDRYGLEYRVYATDALEFYLHMEDHSVWAYHALSRLHAALNQPKQAEYYADEFELHKVNY